MYNRKSLKQPASLKGQALLGSLARFAAGFSHPFCSPFLGIYVHLNKNIAYPLGVCPPHGAGPVTGFRKEPSIEVGWRMSVLHYLWDSVVCLGSRDGHRLQEEVLSFFLSVWNLMRAPSGLRRQGIRARPRTCYTRSYRILKQQPFPTRLSPVCCLMLPSNEKHRVLQLYK